MNETKPTPYRAYDTMTGEELGRYGQMHEAYAVHGTVGVVVYYRPSKRKVKK